MSDTGKLKKQLSKLTQSGASGQGAKRESSAAHPYDCLSLILEEIGDIVLSRDLIVRNTAGHSLSLKVKTRRLIRLNPPAPPGTEDGANLFGAELSASDPDQMAALAGLFSRFCERGSALTFSTTKPEQADSPDEIGLSIERIRDEVIRYTGFEPAEAASDPFAFLNDLTDGDCLAWIRLTRDEIETSWGAEDHITALTQTAPKTLPHLRDRHGGDDRATYWMMATAPDSADITVIGAVDTTAFLAQVPADRLNAWHARCHSRSHSPAN